jgi:dTDP-4-dehydrorhamnose reductase
MSATRKSPAFLVTGANGLVGSRVVARLSEAGDRVLAQGRGPSRLGALPGVDYVELELHRSKGLRELIESARPRGVVHCAAMVDVDACERDPEEAWRMNVRATEAAARGCRAAGARLVAISTDYVFRGDRGPYSEDDVPDPSGTYARTKRAAEEAAMILAPDSAVARIAVVYSGRRGAKRTFASSAAEALLAGKEVRAFEDQVGSPTLADDAARLIVGLLRTGERGVWHCAGGTVVSRFEFCLALARKLGADERLVRPVTLASANLLAPRPRHSGLKVDRIRELLGDGPLEMDAALDRFLAERAA